MPHQAPVSIGVVDVQGREVAMLAEGSTHAGRYQLTWDGRTLRGGRAPDGIYFMRLRTPATES